MKNAYILLASASLLASCSSKPDYDATGIFEATTVTVSAETTGRILSISAEEGDSVIADSRIVLIDTTALNCRDSR